MVVRCTADGGWWRDGEYWRWWGVIKDGAVVVVVVCPWDVNTDHSLRQCVCVYTSYCIATRVLMMGDIVCTSMYVLILLLYIWDNYPGKEIILRYLQVK